MAFFTLVSVTFSAAAIFEAVRSSGAVGMAPMIRMIRSRGEGVGLRPLEAADAGILLQRLGRTPAGRRAHPRSPCANPKNPRHLTAGWLRGSGTGGLGFGLDPALRP